MGGGGGGHYNIRWCAALEAYWNLTFWTSVSLHFLGHPLPVCSCFLAGIPPPGSPCTHTECVAYMGGGDGGTIYPRLVQTLFITVHSHSR